MGTPLPTFRGYVVDLRRQEFRKAHLDREIEIIAFNDPEGKELLALYRAALIARAKNRSEFEDE